MKWLTIRFAVALLTFIIGVTAVVLWVAPRLRVGDTTRDAEFTATSKTKEKHPPEGWKKIEVRDKVVLYIPQNMERVKLLEESFNHREAFRNADIEIVIIYGELNSCATAHQLLERTTYNESVVEIDGKKAKLGIDYYYQPKFITAYVCFPHTGDNNTQLRISAICNTDRSLDLARQIFSSVKFKDNN